MTTFISKTYNTSIKANIGDLLEVSFVDISKYIDPKTGKVFFNLWAPHVIEKLDKGKTTSIKQLEKWVGETTGRVAPKAYPKKGESGFSEFQASPTVTDIIEQEKPYPYVIQHHWRGKSVHADIRFAVNDHLIGFTLADGVEGVIKKPVLDTDVAAALEKRPEIWKIDWSSGEEKKRKTLERKALVEKIWASIKARQPKDWLKVKGKTPKLEKEPVPGGTRKFPGVFHIIDKGLYDMGTQKPAFFEVFLNGRIKGRFLFRKVAGLKEAKGVFTWLYWKPDDQTPYVLSQRGIRKEFVPPKGRSALPTKIKNKIPKELRWWEKRLQGKEALDLIRKSREHLRGELSAGATPGATDSETPGLTNGQVHKWASKKTAQFSLQRRWWKGQKVIRGMPVEDWWLNFSEIEKNDVRFSLDHNPLNVKKGLNAVKFLVPKGKWINFEGQISPGFPGNPNKKIPAIVEILDKGKVDVIEYDPRFISMKFLGKTLKGFWTFKRTDPNQKIWLFQSQPSPKIHPKQAEIIQAKKDGLGINKIKKLFRMGSDKIYNILNSSQEL